ncbi:hypothetical protein [Microbispora rosea]|uniref:hypothetical protein n=1 Tax=Microbispora rosea TaxID=58117 RepID=UPI0012DDA5A3|nr:hypothetical protein [Microbispora rosea]
MTASTALPAPTEQTPRKPAEPRFGAHPAAYSLQALSKTVDALIAREGPGRWPLTPPTRIDRPWTSAERDFRTLACAPSSLAVGGRQVGRGLPRRQMSLIELRDVLIHPSCSDAVRDAVCAFIEAAQALDLMGQAPFPLIA